VGERQLAVQQGDGGVIEVLFAVRIAPDVIDAEVQFQGLDSQAFGFDEQSGHNSRRF
jgi:hypothetical protein